MADKQPDLFAPPPVLTRHAERINPTYGKDRQHVSGSAEAKWRAEPEAKADPQCPHEHGEFDRFGWGRCAACGAELVTEPDGARGPLW